jgi:hypothetical protein
MCTPKVVTNTLVADTAPGASAGDCHISSSSLLLAALPSAALLRNVTDAEKEQQAVLLKQLQERSQDASSVKESNPAMHQVAARTKQTLRRKSSIPARPLKKAHYGWRRMVCNPSREEPETETETDEEKGEEDDDEEEDEDVVEEEILEEEIEDEVEEDDDEDEEGEEEEAVVSKPLRPKRKAKAQN